MNRVQAARRDAVPDRAAPEAERDELKLRYDSVLATGELGQRPLTWYTNLVVWRAQPRSRPMIEGADAQLGMPV